MGKQSDLITAYNKERSRIKRQMSRLEKRGYIFTDNILPEKPKKITQSSVNRLSKITLNKLYEKSEKIDYDTGEIVTGTQGKKQEASERAKKAYASRRRNREENSITLNVVTNKDYEEIQFKIDEDYTKPYIPSEIDLTIGRFYENIENFKGAKGYPILVKWADDLQSKMGRDNFAEMIKEATADGVIITYEVAYSDIEATKFIATMARYIPDNYNRREFMSNLEQGFDTYEEPE